MHEQYEMREVHRLLLARSKKYLLHNIRPSEEFWADLLAKDLFSIDMIDEIRACTTSSERLSQLLDCLPARGPQAFDIFCEVLLECGHSHVAEYLKSQEAQDQFRKDIQNHCTDGQGYMVDKFVQIFRHNAPTIQRLAERKFQLILEEQEKDIEQKDQEMKDIETRNTMLELELSQHRSNINTVEEITDAIAIEIQREFISKTFIKEERKHIAKLKSTSEGIQSLKNMNNFFDNMLTVLDYLEEHVGFKVKGMTVDHNSNCESSFSGKCLSEQLKVITSGVEELIEASSSRNQISISAIRHGLVTVLHQIQGISNDITNISAALRSTVKQKVKLENQTLTVLHDIQEIRRLGRELSEKQAHIAEMTRHKQLLSKKSRQHKKQLDVLNGNIKEKKQEVAEVQESMDEHLSSALSRAETVLKMLPDLDGESTTSRHGSANSRSNMGTPYTYSRPQRDDNANENKWPAKESKVETKTSNDGALKNYSSSKTKQTSTEGAGQATNREITKKSADRKETKLGSANNNHITQNRIHSKPSNLKGVADKTKVSDDEKIERQSSFDKKIALLDKWYNEYSQKHNTTLENSRPETQKNYKKIKVNNKTSSSGSSPRKNPRVTFQNNTDKFRKPDPQEPTLSNRKCPASPSNSSSEHSRGSLGSVVMETEVTPIAPASGMRQSKEVTSENLPSLKKQRGRQALHTNKIDLFVANR